MFAGDDDAEARRRAKQQFENVDNRQAFIRKVFFILGVQLWFTFGSMLLVISNDDAKIWVMQHAFMAIIAAIASMISSCALACCCNEPPCNFVLLFIITCAQAFIGCVLAAIYPPDIILMAVATTAVVTIGLSMFAIQTSIDFTIYGGMIMVMAIIFLIFSIVVMFFPSKALLFAISSMAVLLMSFFLVYDIQLMVGGENRTYAFSPDDYVLAAAMIYLDIIILFFYILQLIGLLSDD